MCVGRRGHGHASPFRSAQGKVQQVSVEVEKEVCEYVTSLPRAEWGGYGGVYFSFFLFLLMSALTALPPARSSGLLVLAISALCLWLR